MPSYPSHTFPTSPITQPDQNRDHKGAGPPHHARRKTTPTRRITVALYVRVSTDKQAEFGMSLEAQTAELQRHCAERNWDVAETFVDAGFSGKDTERPAFQRMVTSIKDGGIDAIAVTKLDRLTRSVRNLCEINEDLLKGLGVHLVCTRDGINTFELASSFLMHLLADAVPDGALRLVHAPHRGYDLAGALKLVDQSRLVVCLGQKRRADSFLRRRLESPSTLGCQNFYLTSVYVGTWR